MVISAEQVEALVGAVLALVALLEKLVNLVHTLASA